MLRASLAILLLIAFVPGARAHAQTVISMPPPAQPAASASSVMTMVARAMERASHSKAGMDALYRYAHARQVPYNVYHVQPRGGMGSNLDWDYDVNDWSLYPRRFWGSYWGWWGWPGCVIWSVDSPAANSPCRASVFAVL
ncbi:MAG: hypothetical protein P8K80_03230 [Phycisphaerales bacterium]|jgi:hypothetical protein|nr:hypothetical protein [Phycisphaerales bacterium]